ncbi:DUF302 domain-containing protein [Calothrix rhizosoleniae]|uniref:DUF302 domain-containing protein n=1 Tax=Calothrix rhizosoleniae TaxID=888997 RepID=UPI000B4A521C|nr:DUF302 domain-containing protein [Calothrix rhizosoleniae]
MKKVFLSVLALGLFVLPAYATKGLRDNPKESNVNVVAGRYGSFKTGKRARRDGIVRVKSAYSVAETARRFEEAVNKPGREALNIIATVDHTDNARKVGKQLRPTQLFVFGNPMVGTPLMQCNQTVGIDLPQKALIWEDEQGKVWLAYNSPQSFLSVRHKLRGCDAEAKQALETVGSVLNVLAQEATQ